MSGEPFSFPVPVARIPTGGKQFRIEASEEERRAVAARLEIVAVTGLTAELNVRPVGAEAFAVRGEVSASVVQTDVVTLEPVGQKVHEAVDLTLFPAEGDSRKKEFSNPAGSETAEDRDIYRNDRIDLGTIAVEHLALGLDPYPRSQGVEFPGHIEAKPEDKSSPFATLAKLKRERE